MRATSGRRRRGVSNTLTPGRPQRLRRCLATRPVWRSLFNECRGAFAQIVATDVDGELARFDPEPLVECCVETSRHRGEARAHSDRRITREGMRDLKCRAQHVPVGDDLVDKAQVRARRARRTGRPRESRAERVCGLGAAADVASRRMLAPCRGGSRVFRTNQRLQPL